MDSAYTVMDAHPLSIIIVVAAMLVTPFHLFATYAFSGASLRVGAALSAFWLVFGAVMTWMCLAGVPGHLGPAGNAVVPVVWLVPSLALIAARRRVLPGSGEPALDQRWIVALQLWRAIGGVFLIEMVRGHVPAVFAYPAGLGDLAVAVVAAGVLLGFRGRAIPGWALWVLIVFGMVDFLSAFFFGVTSADGPQQIFATDNTSRLLEFPTGMIPLFLVPYAIFFHTLSALAARRNP
jgi:hypothetical protein